MNSMHRQRGATLFVALVLLVLLTLMAISSIQTTMTSVQVVGNAQFLEEATTSSQAVIEEVISSNFTANPQANPGKVVSVGDATYTVNVAKPTCISSRAITNDELSMLPPTDPVRKACTGSGAAKETGIMTGSLSGGVVTLGSGGSGTPSYTQTWCYDQQWDIQADVQDTSTTEVKTTVHQGVRLKVPAGTVCP